MTSTWLADGQTERRSVCLLPCGLALLALLVGGCTTGRSPVGYLPQGPSVVEVLEQDHSYILDRGEIVAGRTVFHVENRSGLSHDLSLVALPEDVPPILDQLRSADRRAVTTFARRSSHPPGTSDVFAVDLAPGRYALLCFEKDGTGETPHALMGMALEFRVRSLAPRPRSTG